MTVSIDRIIGLLVGLEGWRDYIYDDKSPWPRSEVKSPDECDLRGGQYKVRATGGTATIGYGETAAEFIDRFWGKRITQAEAMAQMAPRVRGFLNTVQGCIEADLTDHQWEAIACRAYQTGGGGFCRSETARLINAGDLDAALAMWKDEFAHPDRSQVEIAHFRTPDDHDEERPMTRIYTRAEWGAEAAGGRTPAPGMTRGVGIHYLGEGRGPTGGLQDSIAKMQWVQEFHMGPERGWSDFAYNAAVDMHGHAFEGRGRRVRNAANGGGIRKGFDANAGWFSILYLNGTGGPDLTDAAKAAINDVAEWAGCADGEWLGHRDFLSTSCPGDETYDWVHSGHPGGTTPSPPSPPDLEVATMFIFDGPPERGGGVYYTDGRTKWGVANEASLVFFATGKVPHLGVLRPEVFDALPWNTVGMSAAAAPSFAASSEPEPPDVAISGSLVEAMERSDFETGDPGCGEVFNTQ